MTERKFQPGFRLSVLDGAVLIVGGVASANAMTIDRWFGFAIAFVVLHFFLFCNVLRMSRPLELIWAGIFVTLAAATILESFPPWPISFAVCMVVTVIITLIETRRPSYHGVGWQKLNPRLPEWWQSKTDNSKPAPQRTKRRADLPPEAQRCILLREMAITWWRHLHGG